MSEFCLKCHNKINGTHYKRYDVIEEYDICEGCGVYKNVVVDILGHNIFGNTARLFKRLFPKPEPEEVIIEWMHEKDPDEPEAEEIETEYLDFQFAFFIDLK